MSSVEGSDKGEDSLSQELDLVLKNNKIQKSRHYGRGARSANSEDSLYKQALKQYMFGKFDMASESCKKMIANNPENPDPYFLMATMHQQAAQRNNDESQLHKSVEYFFFHAYYSPPSVDKWVKVADMSYDLELYMQAAYCYGRALKMNKSNLEISLKRAECLEMCYEIKKAVSIYKRIIEKISNSAQVYKRYAKLRFRRQQYSKARQILLSFPDFQQDINIKFMIAQTLLKQKKYIELYKFIFNHIIKSTTHTMTNIFEELQIQFIQMLFISRVNCPTETPNNIDIQDMLKYLKEEYEQEESSLYQEIVTYIKKENPEVTCRLIEFLIKYETHQIVENYLYMSQFLMKSGKCREAIKVLEEGLKTSKNKNSVQLKAQLNYLKSLLKNKNNNFNFKSSKPYKNNTKQEEIFYSDEQFEGKGEQPQFQFFKELDSIQNEKADSSLYYPQKETPEKKTKKIKKAKADSKYQQSHHLEVKDPEIISKLIQNNETTLISLKNELQRIQETNQNENLKTFVDRKYSQIKDCLQYLVEIQGSNKQASNFQIYQSSKANHSIFNNKQPKKRRTILGKKGRRLNLITKNSSNLLQSLRYIIFFMKEYLKCGSYSQVIEFAQLLSKAHFFKWQNRIQAFKLLKKQVYEMGVLACLQLKKYAKSIFFLKYLINKNPQNQFYLAIAEKIMRLSAGKLFINSMVKKGLDWENHSKALNLVKMYYLTGLQYMQNCFFELAINMFIKLLGIIEFTVENQDKEQKQMCKTTYLCMSTCLLQIASSRTVFNKLDYVNRSAFCLAKYKNYSSLSENLLTLYNQGRWYSHIKMYSKAISAYQTILLSGAEEDLTERSVLNLMVIYKDLQNYDKIKELGQKYYKQNDGMQQLTQI